MTIVNKLLYTDSYYLASMVIFSNVLKQLFGKKLFQSNFSPRIINMAQSCRMVSMVLYFYYITMIIYILYYLVFKILSSSVRDSSYHDMYY